MVDVDDVARAIGLAYPERTVSADRDAIASSEHIVAYGVAVLPHKIRRTCIEGCFAVQCSPVINNHLGEGIGSYRSLMPALFCLEQFYCSTII